jgi:plastocyanin
MHLQRGWPHAAFTIAPVAMLLVVSACGGGTAASAKNAPPAGGGTVAIAGRDNAFDQTTIKVKANQQIQLTFSNQGAAIHNWHLLNVKSAGGNAIATQLLPGNQSEAITFAIAQPGAYAFTCDVHPTEMRGTLIVQ